MKTLGLGGCLFLLAVSFAPAQPVALPAPPPILSATNRVQRLFGPTAVYDGVFPEVTRRGRIANAFDLRAPVVPGKEFSNISIHPHTGRPQGIVLLAVKF